MEDSRVDKRRIPPILTILVGGLIGCVIGGALGILAVPEDDWCEAFNFAPLFNLWAGGFIGYYAGAAVPLIWYTFRKKPGTDGGFLGVGGPTLLLVAMIGPVTCPMACIAASLGAK